MKKRNMEHGGSIEIVIISVLVVGILAILGFVFWQNFINKPDTNNEATAQTETKYFTIETHNVRIPLTSALSGLEAGTPQASGYSATDEFVPILARELDANWTCEADADGTKGSIGNVSITSQDKRAGPYEPVAIIKMGNYTYGFEEAGSNCAGDIEAYNMLVAGFKEQFSKLESF